MPTAISSKPVATIYRGRRWLAIFLFALALLSLIAAAATVMFDDPWFAVLVMGVPLVVSAHLCLTAGWGEIIARVEIDKDGFSLVLPRYRGFIPFWPAQRLDAKWTKVHQLRRRVVRTRLLIMQFDYYSYSIVTESGRATMIKFLPNWLFNTSTGTSQNIPVSEVIMQVVGRTGLALQDEGEVLGGGFFHNIFFGDPS